MSKQTATATVGEFFTWYAGPEWKEDWQTTNTMTVDNVHAQDDGENGMTILKFLAEHENSIIEIEGEFVICAIDIEFQVDGKEIMVQASGFYGEEE